MNSVGSPNLWLVLTVCGPNDDSVRLVFGARVEALSVVKSTTSDFLLPGRRVIVRHGYPTKIVTSGEGKESGCRSASARNIDDGGQHASPYRVTHRDTRSAMTRGHVRRTALSPTRLCLCPTLILHLRD